MTSADLAEGRRRLEAEQAEAPTTHITDAWLALEQWLGDHAAALIAEAEAAARLREALTRIASYQEGPTVTASFDEPCSAAIARKALEPPAEEHR